MITRFLTMPDIGFWLRIVSTHMAGLATALARLGCKVTYRAQEAISTDRVHQGWTVLAGSVGGVFKVDDRLGLKEEQVCQLAKGKVTAARRERLAARATCLGASAGARYFLNILDHAETN